MHRVPELVPRQCFGRCVSHFSRPVFHCVSCFALGKPVFHTVFRVSPSWKQWLTFTGIAPGA